jgi:hypothetical protein
VTPAGWYADPSNPAALRYWDGAAWTAHTAPAAPPAPPPAQQYAPVPGPVQPVVPGYGHSSAVPGLFRSGDRVVVPSIVVASGFAPQVCVSHHRTGGTTQVKFLSRTPAWVWVTILVGLIWPLIIAAVLRNTVVSPAWPVCQQCRDERRRNLLWTWVSIAAWIPVFLVLGNLPQGLSDGVLVTVWSLGIIVPLVAAVWFGNRSSLTQKIGAVVAADGLTVSFPVRAFAGVDLEALGRGAAAQFPSHAPDPRFGSRV